MWVIFFPVMLCLQNMSLLDFCLNVIFPKNEMFVAWEGIRVSEIHWLETHYFNVPCLIYHLTRFLCTLNLPSNLPADISWQTGEYTDLLNPWLSAFLFKCVIKVCMWKL